MTMYYRNLKNNKTYKVIGEAINCTNEQNGQEMYIYCIEGCNLTFVRSKEEFHKKFVELNTKE